jgi:hypothetical protein
LEPAALLIHLDRTQVFRWQALPLVVAVAADLLLGMQAKQDKMADPAVAVLETILVAKQAVLEQLAKVTTAAAAPCLVMAATKVVAAEVPVALVALQVQLRPETVAVVPSVQ